MRLHVILTLVGVFLLTQFVSASDIVLDVGNDTAAPWEWNQVHAFVGPETTNDFSATINRILSDDCKCSGCSTDSQYCIIPLRIQSAYFGDMNLSNINFTWKYVHVISNVTYDRPFKLSDGCQWQIQHLGGISLVSTPSSYSGSRICYYTSSSHSPIQTEDAMVDGMYRLLNQTLDSDQNGVIDLTFDEDAMSFQTHGTIGVQSLWGPAVIKVIVWV
ncbi:MAG: hypothetical protein V1703_00505 [Candidatus Altiarchaeota archaeon]